MIYSRILKIWMACIDHDVRRLRWFEFRTTIYMTAHMHVSNLSPSHILSCTLTPIARRRPRARLLHRPHPSHPFLFPFRLLAPSRRLLLVQEQCLRVGAAQDGAGCGDAAGRQEEMGATPPPLRWGSGGGAVEASGLGLRIRV
jgi:hypothetical protein